VRDVPLADLWPAATTVARRAAAAEVLRQLERHGWAVLPKHHQSGFRSRLR
jgi:hypothetical protein